MERAEGSKRNGIIILFIVLSLSYFISSFHRVALSVLSVPIMEEIDITIDTISTLGSVLFFIYAIIQIPCGHLCDRIGPRKIMLVSLVITSLGSLLFGLANNSTSLLLARMVLSVGISTVYIPAISFVRLLFRNEKLGTFTGGLLAFGTFGTVVASKPLQIFIDHFSWRICFYIFAVLSLVLSIVIARLTKDIKMDTVQSKSSDLQKSKGLGLNTSFVLLILIFTACSGAVQSFQGLWFIPYFTEGYNFSFENASNLLLMFSSGYFLGSPIMGWMCDRFDTKKLVSIVALCNALIWVFLGTELVQSSGVYLMITLLLLGFFSSGMTSIGFYYVGKYARLDKRALITSILGFGGYMTTSILLKLMGSIISSSGGNMGKLNIIFLIYSAFIFVAGVLFIINKREKV